MHNPVEILCRHADCVVRKLRIQVGTMLNDYRPPPLLPALMPSTACALKKNFDGFAIHIPAEVVHSAIGQRK